MSTKMRIVDDAPILVVTFLDPIAVPGDADDALAAGAELQNSTGGKICRVLDFSQANLNFGDMVVGMSYERGKAGGVYDEDVYNIFVGTDDWVKLGVESLGTQEHYKGANVKGLFTSEADAVEAARALLSTT
jgi:hypothetical protein